MEVSKEVSGFIRDAIINSASSGYEYVTPESLLLEISMNEKFQKAFEACGGNIAELGSKLMQYIEKNIDKTDKADCKLSAGTEQALSYAEIQARSSGRNEVNMSHVISGIWNLQDSYAVYFMEIQGVEESDLLRNLAQIEEEIAERKEEYGSFSSDAKNQAQGKEGWKLYAPCLNDTLKDVNPLIGREEELERTIRILCRKDKNNPLHIGETGVGKTAVTYGLVQMIKEDKVPGQIKGSRVFALDLGSMLAGTQYRGDIEKRFKKVLAEIEKEEKPIIYIDEIHNLAGAGAVGESSFDA